MCGGAASEQPHVFWEANELKVFFSISVSLQSGLIYMETTCSLSSTGYAMSLQPPPTPAPRLTQPILPSQTHIHSPALFDTLLVAPAFIYRL